MISCRHIFELKAAVAAVLEGPWAAQHPRQPFDISAPGHFAELLELLGQHWAEDGPAREPVRFSVATSMALLAEEDL